MDAMHGPTPQLQDYLTHSARQAPDKLALVCGVERVQYVELERRSNALAHALAERGVRRGDRVLIYADNTVEAVVAFWAVLKANAVVVMVNPLTKTDKLAYLVRDCRPSALVTELRLREAWAESARSPYLKTVVVAGAGERVLSDGAPPPLRFEDALQEGDETCAPRRQNLDVDLAAIVYTSGSTGEPKGVMLTHRNMLSAASSVSAYLALQGDDVVLGLLPLAFDYGLYQMIMSFRAGARLVLERSFAFPARILRVMEVEGVTVLPGVPTIFALLAELKTLHEYDLSKLRLITSTAAALPSKHISMLQRQFPRARIYSMYGLTECKRCTYLPPEDLARKPTSVGIPIPNTELWIVDERGQRLGPHVVGQLVIRGATVMKGYWEKPEATAQKLKPGPLPGEQVLWTGDYCKLDEEGYLYFVARMDDVIKSRGEKVAPKEVEAVLMSMEGIREAAVIGVPDATLGEAVHAFVVLEQGVRMSAKQVQLFCGSKLERFMVPQQVEFLAELPKTDTGKIKKIGLSRA